MEVVNIAIAIGRSIAIRIGSIKPPVDPGEPGEVLYNVSDLTELTDNSILG